LLCAFTAALVQFYTGSFGPSTTACGLTKVVLLWPDNRQLLPIRRRYAFLNTPEVIV
jgi:hypothetical protein